MSKQGQGSLEEVQLRGVAVIGRIREAPLAAIDLAAMGATERGVQTVRIKE